MNDNHTHSASATMGSGGSYAQAVRDRWSDSRIWDYLCYDSDGHLWLGGPSGGLCGGLRVSDAVTRYGAPLEIVDTTLVEKRCADWMDLTRSVVETVRYPGAMRFLYAAKANMASEVAHAAYRSGWGAETSARQDLMHLRWLGDHGLLPDGFRVVCNGFKLPRANHSMPSSVHDTDDRADAVVLPTRSQSTVLRPMTYAEAIVDLAQSGWNVTPVLDEGELDTFAEAHVPEMTVGLRMKHGRVADADGLDKLVSRFGLSRHRLRREAARVAAVDHLRLGMLHTMVGAADTIPVDRFVAALMVAVETYADLKPEHSGLTEMNIGGGIPPLAEPYDHRGFVSRLLAGVKDVCEARGVPAPDITFELGSLVAAECGFHVLPVLQTKSNHVAEAGEIVSWSIVDGGLMAAIPDMLIIDKPFRILAVENATAPPMRTRLGDITCDSDGRYPPKSFGPEADVLLPEHQGKQHILIQGVGAYQEILAGVRGAHHCGLLEAPELVLERRTDGRVHGRLLPRQTPASAAALLGYVDEAVDPLGEALRASLDRKGKKGEGE